jgi:hypothetical protein
MTIICLQLETVISGWLTVPDSTGNKDSRAVSKVTEASSVTGEQKLLCAGGVNTKEFL